MDTNLVQVMTTIVEAVQFMYDEGIRSIDIYYAELISDGETEWAVDVMCDPINEMTGDNWTWEIWALDEMKKFFDDDVFFVCEEWNIVTDKPFSDDVVRGAVTNWMLSNGVDMTVSVIDIDYAAGSGYIKQLREMDLEKEISNATPFDELCLGE